MLGLHLVSVTKAVYNYYWTRQIDLMTLTTISRAGLDYSEEAHRLVKEV